MTKGNVDLASSHEQSIGSLPTPLPNSDSEVVDTEMPDPPRTPEAAEMPETAQIPEVAQIPEAAQIPEVAQIPDATMTPQSRDQSLPLQTGSTEISKPVTPASASRESSVSVLPQDTLHQKRKPRKRVIYEISDEEEDEEEYKDEDGDADDTQEIPATEELPLQAGEAFDKSQEFDRYLNDPNPWHPDLRRKLFQAQVIGFRWMADRHTKGGGLIFDAVGCGKVWIPHLRGC
jgi:hypothetical protein